MSLTRPIRRSRRTVMYAVVGFQLGLLAFLVVLHEANRAFDAGPAVTLEMSGARARKHPFRGASVDGRLTLNLDGAAAAVPAERLQPGERVLLFFTPGKDRRPEITTVARRNFRADPLFGADTFSIPGTVVRGGRTESAAAEGERLIAQVGKPPVPVELDLPASIPVEESTLRRFIGPGMVQASLRRGAVGYRYLTDVKIAGEGWGPQASATYDAKHDRLIVFASREERPDRRPFAGQTAPRSAIYFFDGAGKELQQVELPGRVIEGVVNPADGALLALLSDEAWGYGPASITRIGEDGAVLQRGPQVVAERVLGLDAEAGGLWVLAGAPTAPLRAPFFVERMTLDGPQGVQLGPFPSRPRMVLSARHALWVLEPDRHCITRLDRTGRIEREYADLNRATDVAVDGDGLVVIEDSQTQLSKFSLDGRVVWRIPRFQGLSWVVPDTGGGGWAGASSLDGRAGGVFRYQADGRISRLPEAVAVRSAGDWNRSRLSPEAVRDTVRGRFYIRETVGVVILGPDGSLLRRLEGFRYPSPRSLQG